MSIYKISKLIESLSSSRKDGYEYVEIDLIPPEDDTSETISLDYINDSSSSVNDMIDSVPLPDGYHANVEW